MRDTRREGSNSSGEAAGVFPRLMSWVASGTGAAGASAVRASSRSPTVNRGRDVCVSAASGASSYGPRAGGVRFDSHVHVWAPESERGTKYAVNESNLPPAGLDGSAEALCAHMDAHQVQGALLVQSSSHGFDPAYVDAVVARYPGRFKVMGLADPEYGATPMRCAAQLGVMKDKGYVGVRFNPALFAGQKDAGVGMAGERALELFRQAGRLGMAVGYMLPEGYAAHANEVEALLNIQGAVYSPRGVEKTTVILDHFGFAQGLDGDDWKALAKLADDERVMIKASALFRGPGKGKQWPYKDAHKMLKEAVRLFGKDRVMWGTDWPWVDAECGYGKAWSLLDEIDDEDNALTQEEWDAVLGKNAMRVFGFQPGLARLMSSS